MPACSVVLLANGCAQEAAPAMPMPLPVWQETKEIAKKVTADNCRRDEDTS